MRKAKLAETIQLAAQEYGPVGKLVHQCVEVEVIVPSILTARLEEAGCKVTFHTGPGDDAPEGEHEHGAWCLVKSGEEIVARAYSEDETDAFLQAIAAEVRAEAAPHLAAAAKRALAEQVKAALASTDPEQALAQLLGFEVSA